MQNILLHCSRSIDVFFFKTLGITSTVSFKVRMVLAYLLAWVFSSTLLMGARESVTTLPVHSCAGCSWYVNRASHSLSPTECHGFTARPHNLTIKNTKKYIEIHKIHHVKTHHSNRIKGVALTTGLSPGLEPQRSRGRCVVLLSIHSGIALPQTFVKG